MPSPVLMTNPRVHNIGMALLTPSFGLVVPNSIPPLSSQRMAEGAGDGQKTDLCPCHSDLIRGPFPEPSHIRRSKMASMDQRKWRVGSQPVTSWTGLLHLFLLYPLHPSHFTILSGSGILEGIQLSPLINHSCLHCSYVIDRHLYMLTLTF